MESSDQGPVSAQLAADLPGDWQLVVKFRWHGDRFTHCIDVVPVASKSGGDPPAGQWRVAIAAQDAEETAWPSSPPLQQLDECQLAGDRRGLVGLGMAGSSHWSMAVESDAGQLWFDIACRVQRPPEIMQSVYELPQACCGTALAGSTGNGGLALAGLPQGVSLELRPDPRTTTLDVSCEGRRVRLRPSQVPDGLPATIRWRYGFVATA